MPQRDQICEIVAGLDEMPVRRAQFGTAKHQTSVIAALGASQEGAKVDLD